MPSAKDFDSKLNLVHDAGFKHMLHSNSFMWIEHALLDIVGNLVQIDVFQVLVSVEAVLAEATLGQALSQSCLASLEATVDLATRASVCSLVTTTACFPE